MVKYQISRLSEIPKQFKILDNSPKKVYFTGDKSLLNKRLVSIVGTRRPSNYTKEWTAKLAHALSKAGIVVVSGGAMGVDAIAHKNSYPNTIAILANSLDFFYPAINEKLLSKIYENSLALSEYEKDFKARPYTFVHRNRLVVALGECLIVTEADEDSGSLRSVEFALKQNKKIFVLPHRLGESRGTQKLALDGKAEIIYDIDTFISQFFTILKIQSNSLHDKILEFCKSSPSLDKALKLFGDKIYEYELEGKIEIKNLKVYVL